ncbi:hypothetical protein M378DRAFT_157417, partial [Amanita muscaria Koide BX008]
MRRPWHPENGDISLRPRTMFKGHDVQLDRRLENWHYQKIAWLRPRCLTELFGHGKIGHWHKTFRQAVWSRGGAGLTRLLDARHQ